MKCFRFFKTSFFDLMRAKIRPGVPTTMCGQLVFNACSSLAMERPPKKTPTYKIIKNLTRM
jgi:hypothetical protein